MLRHAKWFAAAMVLALLATGLLLLVRQETFCRLHYPNGLNLRGVAMDRLAVTARYDTIAIDESQRAAAFTNDYGLVLCVGDETFELSRLTVSNMLRLGLAERVASDYRPFDRYTYYDIQRETQRHSLYRMTAVFDQERLVGFSLTVTAQGAGNCPFSLATRSGSTLNLPIRRSEAVRVFGKASWTSSDPAPE